MRRSAFVLYLGLSSLTILLLKVLLALTLLHSHSQQVNKLEEYGRDISNGMRPPLVCDESATQRLPDMVATDRILKEVFVHPPPVLQANENRILCFMMTHSGAHHTKVKAVMETWGSQCDGWFIASNETDAAMGTTKMQTPALYNRLWVKLNETMRYIASNYISHYDWFYKVDDDTFVIMENLREFLRIKEQPEEHMPQIYGYLLRDETWGQQQQRYFDISKANQAFGDYFLSHVRNASSHVEYLAGGSGYIMNQSYLRKFVSAVQSNLTLFGEVPEDMAHGATMLAHNVTPLDSRDPVGREYFIPEEPALWELRHNARSRSGPIASSRRRCCARYTVAFHHISVPLMRAMYDRLYLCRSGANG
jgi:glycoprotein-N-acetylgalactosamine 3-beta-galactosyltransferase